MELSIEMCLYFPHPILGSEVPDIVRSFVDPAFFVLATDPETPNHILVGQGSEHEGDHVVVTAPGSEVIGIQPDVAYAALIIKRYRWCGVYRIERDEYERSLQAVIDFSRKFDAAVKAWYISIPK